ncbi:MAG: M1 family metallopeptidase [Bacteroidota bacterium]
MRNQALLLVFIYCTTYTASGQQTSFLKQATWQQRVDYEINVRLDDMRNELSGAEIIQYTNGSPNKLDTIYMHLWPNAYKNNETAFAKQQIRNGKTDFYFAEEADRGYIDSLSFEINGETIKWQLTGDIDIAILIPNKPVKPGESITISTPFKVKLPKVFSRMGHENQLYCITQWYPKPAVYDVNGWNPMPYLDQGEFYSEFGSFDVRISVPENYIVAATGCLTNADELQKLFELSKKKFTSIEGQTATPEKPASAANYKTLRYVQDSIHDFAWFCDKRFKVERSEVILPQSGRKITTWFYSNNPKKSVVHWIDSAILFYSAHVGEYPFKQATGVYTPLLAGGGMEYPTITNMSTAEQQVIVHEVGHNWFYGILGNNERLYPWMDESFNNYYETRSAYLKKVPAHGGITLSNLKGNNIQEEFSGLNFYQLHHAVHARLNDDQPVNIKSDSFTSENYGSMVYAKGTLNMMHLNQYLGDSLFDQMMKAYFEKWKFKHPLPDDFREHAESFTGKNLSWFFEELMGKTRIPDWRVKKFDAKTNKLFIEAYHAAGIPFPVTLFNNDIATETKWYDGFAGKDTSILLPGNGFDYIVLDAYEHTPDFYRYNNATRTRGLFKTWRKPALQWIANIEKPNEQRIFVSPILGMNLYNKTMLGMAFYNGLVPSKKTDFTLVPMYAFGTRDLVGYAEVNHFSVVNKLGIKDITFTLKAARFGTYGDYVRPDIDADGSINNSTFIGTEVYEKIEPSALIRLSSKKALDGVSQFLRLCYTFTTEDKFTPQLLRYVNDANSFLTASYRYEFARSINPCGANIAYQWGSMDETFQKIQAEANYTISYEKPKKGFSIRAFAGAFMGPYKGNDSRVLYRAGNQTGYTDYLYNQSQFGRGEGNPSVKSNSLFAQQLMFGELSFKELYPLAQTNRWALASNLETTLPGILPLRVYADFAFINYELITNVGSASGTTTTSSLEYKFLYTGGISVILFREILRINFPMVASNEIVEYFKGNAVNPGKSYGERISFSLDLNKLNPIKAVRNIKF